MPVFSPSLHVSEERLKYEIEYQNNFKNTLSEYYRTKTADGTTEFKEYEKWYKKPAAPKEELEASCYGLADFYKPDTSYIANPGCYATATILGIAPLLLKQLIKLDSLIVDAKSGVSGSGKKLTENSHYPVINENALLYKINSHQHIPEILQQLKKFDSGIESLQFSTTLIPITRGIMATIYAKPKDADGFNLEALKKAYAEVYHGKKCVRVLEEGFPQIKDVQYSNYCDIGVAYDELSKTISVVSVIDNLVKGAAGQAVQNMNDYFGLDEPGHKEDESYGRD